METKDFDSVLDLITRSVNQLIIQEGNNIAIGRLTVMLAYALTSNTGIVWDRLKSISEDVPGRITEANINEFYKDK